MEKDFKNSYKVFHSTCDWLRDRINIVLVRPEQGGNVGSVARALENMGVNGKFIIVDSPTIINQEAYTLAKHAKTTLEKVIHLPSLEEAFKHPALIGSLKMAASARIGSAHRPHPLRVREAIQQNIEKMKNEELASLTFVFGPESDGLTNPEIEICDSVVTIPSTSQYRSLNLSQSVLIFSYEMNMALLNPWEPFTSVKPSTRDKLISNIVQLAEESGFILPNDPFKMKPRLETILSKLPRNIPEINTWHGLLDQIRRSLRTGKTDIKGRFKNFLPQNILAGESHDGK